MQLRITYNGDMSYENRDWTEVWHTIREDLKQAGINLEKVGVDLGEAFKVVCVSPDIQDSVDEMSRSQRDQVVMVRVDEESSHQLDEWVKTEAVKSRSEAAALFIREGLKVRAAELEQLHDALADVDRARERLQERVQEVFGEQRQSDNV